MVNEIKGVTFDLAYTLIYPTGNFPNYCKISELLNKYGYDIYPQELEAARQYVFFIDFPRGDINSWESWTKKILLHLGYPKPTQNILSELIAMLKAYTDSFKLYEDAPNIIRYLHNEGIKLSIVTTIPEFKFIETLGSLVNYFDYIVTGHNAKCVKGNPKMYKFDLDSKNLAANQNLFVGDDLFYDIEIPKKIGEYTGFINRHNKKCDLTFVDYEFKSLKDIKYLFMNS